MTIGLIILGVLAVLVFFGAAERFFRKLGIPNWLAFILVLTFVVGALVPEARIGSMFVMNIGGFIVPLVLSVAIAIMIGKNAELFRAGIATLGVAATAVATRMLIMPISVGLQITASVIVGFVGGAVAFLIGRSVRATLAASLGGIVLGDVITSVVYHYFVDGSAVALGTRGVFDSLAIAAVFGVLTVEVIETIRRHGQAAVIPVTVEAAEDTDLTGIIPQEKIGEYTAEEVEAEDGQSSEDASENAHVDAFDLEMAADPFLFGVQSLNGNGVSFGSPYGANGFYPAGYAALLGEEQTREENDRDENTDA